MSRLNVDKLLKALDNDNNESIIETNKSDIKQIKNNVFQQLNLPKDKLKEYHLKLRDYRYVDDVSEIQSGCFFRWINLKNPENISLTRGAFLCDIGINNDGIHLIFKIPYGQHCQIRMDEVFLFQKLTEDEHVILSAMKFL